MEEGEEEKSFSFSKLKKKFKRDSSSGDEMALDLSKVTGWFKSHKKFIVYALLVLLLLFSASIRFAPEKKYTGIYENSLSAMDPYWHYRHAKNVYEHGFVGETKVCYAVNVQPFQTQSYDGVACPDGYRLSAWDTMHDAPEGGPADQEFLPYFTAYSYKYFGKLFAPSLLVWHRWTPAIFGVLAVFGMFLLGKQLFGPYAGLAAGFLFSLAPSFISRSVSGFADTDALIAFFSVFTFYFFIKAWDSSSFIYGIIGGITLGLFGVTWSAYKFAPLLILGCVFFYFVSRVGLKFLTESRNITKIVLGHFSNNWKKYVILLLIFFIGFSMIGMVRGVSHINFLSVIKTSTGLKVVEVVGSAVEGEAIRNVYKTVAEMNPSTFREVIVRLHIALVLLAVGFAALLPFGLWKKMKTHVHHLAFFSLWVAATLFMSLRATRFVGMLVIPVCIFAGISIAFAISKMKAKKPVVSIILGLIIFVTIFAVPNIPIAKGGAKGVSYYTTGMASVKQTGPSLGPNWFDFLYWARDETPKNAIFASWWDPGHAMTAVGERPSVADGSQNFRHVHDLAIAFTTTNESLAIERLKKYNVAYFYTSSDLINKYGAISFLASGSGENYPMLRLSDVKNTASGTVLIYPFGQGASVLVNINDAGIRATLRQGYQSQAIDRVFYYTNSTGFLSDTNDDNAIDALLYLDPSYQQAFFLPVHLEKNILTQLHFFYGQNLEHFELVKNFGNEIRVFKVRYE